MMHFNSDSDSMDDGSDNENKGLQKGRRNIREIKKSEDLNVLTRKANREEEDRRSRIQNAEKKFQDVFAQAFPEKDPEEELILDFDFDTLTPRVSVHKDLVSKLKSHQREGIKFMWNACYESLERCKKSEGSGCVIAHCMGLGKTFQVIALIHTLLNHPNIGTRTILICCPKNTVLNWVNEFKIWITSNLGEINVFNPARHDNHTSRLIEVNRWQSEGGVCVINYELMRKLLEGDTKDTKQFPLRQRKKFEEALGNPGADLVICDEGHMLKNEETKLSKVMNKIKTLRRIILTGTPMQNNLKEYHVMVSFVKPNLLGSRTEFLNMFVNPILNGQYENSLPADVQLMKERSHVLHKTLSGCVQRFDLMTLTRFLPEKQEYVIALRLTDIQIQMYQFYLDSYSAKGNPEYRSKSTALFSDHQALQRVYTHPHSLKLHMEKQQKEPKKFIGKKKKRRSSETEDDESSGTEYSIKKPISWWMRFVNCDDFNDARSSSKLVFLLEVLKQCENNGEKLLVFSGSLYSIRLIEHFLMKISNSQFENPALCNMTSTWIREEDYFVLTGQTSAEDREKYCRSFNNVHDSRPRLFLISTKAGGLGINLTAANRAIIFDASWNPSYDIQSIFRLYRLGQTKPCFVYRLLASGTMEEKIYERQVTKQSISHRVVDEKQIARHYTETELQELYQFEPDKEYVQPTVFPRDSVLRRILNEQENIIGGYHEHDSLLEHKHEEELGESEKTGAWSAFNVINNPDSLSEVEKSFLGRINSDSFQPEFLKQVLRRKYTDAFPEEINLMYEQLLPRMQQILLSPDLNEIMKKEALYSRKKKLTTASDGSIKIVYSSVGSGFDSFTSGNKGSDSWNKFLQGKGAFSAALSLGNQKNLFSTGRSISILRKKPTRRERSATSGKSNARPLKVWGSIAGREYGSPEKEDS